MAPSRRSLVGYVRRREEDGSETNSQPSPKLPRLLIRRRGATWPAEIIPEPSGQQNTRRLTANAIAARQYRARLAEAIRRNWDRVYSPDELSAIDRDYQLVVPSSDRVEEITKTALKKMQSYQMEDAACAVCEILKEATKINRKPLTPDLIKKMQTRLHIPTNASIGQAIVDQYDASTVLADLKGLLLYPPAITSNSNDEVFIDICTECEEDLGSKTTSGPPVMAIANGNYIGWMPPHLDGLSRTDEQSIALVVPCISLSTLTGGSCKVVKSHHYIVKNTEGPVLEMLPRDLTGRVRVTMVGAMTSAQQAACRRRYELNVPLCHQALAFLVENNPMYKQEIDRVRSNGEQAFVDAARTSVVIDRTSSSEVPIQGDAIERGLRDNSTYSTFGSTIEDGSSEVVEEISVPSSKIVLQQTDATTDILVRKSTAYANVKNWATVTQMFPLLFPGGCGGPDEKRSRKLSLRKWILRCLSLVGHRFERHYAFLLLAFDFLAVRSARRSLYVKMKVSTAALAAGTITTKTLLDSVKYCNHLSHANAHGLRAQPVPESVKKIVDVRKGLNTSEGAYFGSNLSRMRARHDLFGYLQRFGVLQLFFTISPDSSGTYSIAVKSGAVPKVAIDSANLAMLPSRAERKRIAGSHPMQCARYFERVVDTVIENILGWDTALARPKRGGGVFGVVRAFGGAAETQQAGDLHAHFAVWLHGFPQSSGELHDLLSMNGPFRERVLRFADTVISTKLPALPERDTCPAPCRGHLNSVYAGIEAFRRPLPGQKPPTTSS